MRLVTPDAMREADRRTIEAGTPGLQLMETAGRAVAEEAWREFPHADWKAVVLCGGGNNGGDGFVAARELRGRYRIVDAILAGTVEGLRGDARAAADSYLAAGGEIVSLTDASRLREALLTRGTSADGAGKGTLLLDALLGTGTHGEVTGLARDVLEVAVGSGSPVVAVDAPSGLDMTTGARLGPVLRAALTVTFGRAKLGHVLGEGPDCTGRLVVRDIGLDPEALREADERDDAARVLEPVEAEALLPLPARRAHKRSNGVVAIVAGSRAYTGAAVLTCHGALRSGAGLVHALGVEDLKQPLSAALPEVIASVVASGRAGSFGPAALDAVRDNLGALRPHAIVIGPGLGGRKKTQAFVRELVLAAADLAAPPADGARRKRSVPGGPPLSVLLDADGLNAFAGSSRELRDVAARVRLAITPHPGELGRVLEIPAAEVDSRRVEVARRTAEELGCTVLLKGVPTVVCAPERGTVLNLTGNPGLARGGTGDLLSGIAGAFLAKRMDPFDALALAAFVHGLAADRARADLGSLAMTASDVGERLPWALSALERGTTREALSLSSTYASLVLQGGEAA